MKTNRRRALIFWSGIILPICVIIIVLWFTTDDTAVKESATEDFGNCFGGATEDVGLWSACPGRIKWEDVIAALTLIFMAACSLEFIAERWLRFAVARKQTRAFHSEIAQALYHGHIQQALNTSATYTKSPLAVVVSASLQSNKNSPETKAIKLSMQERQRTIVIQTADIKRRLWTLAAIGWTAPLVGLFIASINTMQAMTGMKSAEGTSLLPVTSDIISAMFNMAFGLVIAVPAIWAHKYFSSQVETFALEMDRLSLAIIEQIMNQQQSVSLQLPDARYVTQELNPHPTHRIID